MAKAKTKKVSAVHKSPLFDCQNAKKIFFFAKKRPQIINYQWLKLKLKQRANFQIATFRLLKC